MIEVSLTPSWLPGKALQMDLVGSKQQRPADYLTRDTCYRGTLVGSKQLAQKYDEGPPDGYRRTLVELKLHELLRGHVADLITDGPL